MELLEVSSSPNSCIYRSRVASLRSRFGIQFALSTDPPNASHFGSLAPGACASPPPCPPSTRNYGDAGVIGAAQKAINRYNAGSSRPKRHPVQTAPLAPLPRQGPSSDTCSDLREPSQLPLSSPLLPNPHPFEPNSPQPLCYDYRPSSQASLTADLESLRTPVIVEAPMTPSNDAETEDIAPPEAYTELPLTPPRRVRDPGDRPYESASNFAGFNSLGLQFRPQVVTFGSEIASLNGPLSAASSSLRVASSLSERLRRLAPAPLFIPGADAFMSDSGIELTRTPPQVVENPVTALYFPAIHTPPPEYTLPQTHIGPVAQTEHPGSSTTRIIYTPARGQDGEPNRLTRPSPRTPPPLGRQAPQSLPAVTPSVLSAGNLLGGGSNASRPDLVTFGTGQDGADALSPLAWSAEQPEEHFDDVGDRALSCANSVDWIFYSLGTCAFIARDELELLCSSLRDALSNIAHALRHGPPKVDLLVEAHGLEWGHRYHRLIESLQRHIDYFYLQADQLGKRPPRVHRVATIWSKLWGYLSKFESVERELEV
ncbi:hypothetical protein EIP86_008351 [Pleurotus ostreatoroseus]|nr:hypothetical protein EIP86_008351 [Pleurotus ostreatoroseus]